jgi:hypothetical protein
LLQEIAKAIVVIDDEQVARRCVLGHGLIYNASRAPSKRGRTPRQFV